MTELQNRFELAQKEVVELEEAPDVQTKLRLYALYKQAHEGDVKGDRPSAVQFVAQAKFDAWAKLAGTGSDEAMRAYIALVDELKAAEA
ncbi:acyl-CoA-binding protein [Chitinibacteraceae bacterium HSL-7]